MGDKSFGNEDFMKEKFIRFMMGRYGNDQLNRALLGLALVLIVLNMFVGSGLLNLLGLAALILCYVRMFSRNIQKRYQENQKYLAKTAKLRQKFVHEKWKMQQRKEYHIYKCPNCKQEIRIPKGKGRISITCPKCRKDFIKNS